MRWIIVISFLMLTAFVWGQNEFEVEVDFLSKDSFFKNSELNTNPVLPQLGNKDSIGFNLLKPPKNPKKDHYLRIFPLMDVGFDYSKLVFSKFSMVGGLGVGVEGKLNKQLYGRVWVLGDYRYSDFMLFHASDLYRTPYWDFGDERHRAGIYPHARVSYAPYDFLNLQVGFDQNFIGQGSRSMLLGDYTAPYPFVQLRTKIWRLEMTNLYQFFNEDKLGENIPKYASTHFFNYYVTPRLQIGLFESVVFAPKDTVMNRGYELAYLNPFLFYRPTEYGLGSQDRLVVGLNLSYEFNPIMIYGQFVLDEFVLSELMEKTRWWANKYGGQIGVKGKVEISPTVKFQGLAELNFARPFIYSHLDVNTVYGHKGRPLAHPMGSNFVEVYTEASFIFQSGLALKPRFFFAQQGGFDGSEEVSYGNNVYQSYVKRPFDHGFHIGGNGKLNRIHFSMEVSYTLSKKLKLEAFVRPGMQFVQIGSDGYGGMFHLIGGVRTSLWRDHSLSF